MFAMLTSSDPRSRLGLAFLCFFLVIVLLFGGASRADVLSQLACRLAALGLICVSLWQIGRADLRNVRGPLIFLLAIAALIAIQLVPIPYSLWLQLPGRAPFVEVIDAVGAQGQWRPISLTPDLTLNSLLALLPALAVILGLAPIDRALYRLLIPFLLICLLVTVLVGLLQLTNPAFYFYQVTNRGSAVGIFANRNHQAVFLAAAFPLLAAWAALPNPDRSYARLRSWAALCMAAGIFPLLLITGSRGGVILALLSAALSFFLTSRSQIEGRSASGPRWRRLAFVGLPLLVGLGAIALVILFSRAEALERFFPDGQVEARTQASPVFMQMARDFFPFGSGFGSFDPVYRGYEPYAALDFSYMNHAHNELAQIVIEGGAIPLILLAVFLGWAVVRSWKLWSRKLRSTDQMMGRAGSIILLILLLSSLVDYPLRTPFLSVLMAIACLFMLAPGRPAEIIENG